MMMKLLLFTLLGLLHCSAGDPLLVCQKTVKARISDNVTLTCQLDSEENIQDETFHCKRPDSNKLEPKQNIKDKTFHCKIAASNQLVYARRNGKQLPDQKDQYKHRTSLDFEGLKIGDLNLTINSVTQSDNGTYQFYIHTWDICSTVTLIVEPADLKKTERQNSSSAETSVTGVPPPSGDPPSGVPLGVVIGVPVAFIALVVVVLILVKRKKIRRCWTRMMKRRDLKSQHGDKDPQRAAGNGHLPPEHPAERDTML